MSHLYAGLLLWVVISTAFAHTANLDSWMDPEVIEHGDWSTACDNIKDCTAVSVSREYVKRIKSTDPGDYASPKLWIKRRAGPDAAPRIFVDTSTWGEAMELGPLTLHVSRDCDGDCTGRGYRLTQIEKGRYELAPHQVAAFLTESAKTNQAATRRKNGSMHGIITTTGLVAAVRYIEESQQRRGTVTAHYSKGKQAADTVPNERVRPVVRAMRGVEEPVRDGLYPHALHARRIEFCKSADANTPDVAVQRYKLANGQRLWSVGCQSDGAEKLWLIETADNRFGVHKLPRPVGSRDAQLPILPNSEFDPRTGQLSASLTGKACGWKRRWAWTGDAFEMIESIEMPACLDLSQNTWLQTYRAVLVHQE